MLAIWNQCLETCRWSSFKRGRLSSPQAYQPSGWVCCDESLPVLDSYCYLEIVFSSDGSWDKHTKSWITRNRYKLSGLYKVFHNLALDFKNCRHILMVVLRPILEHGCEVWSATKSQANPLESIQLRACKYVLWCSVTTCDEPESSDLGLETLKYRKDFCKLKWYHKVKLINDENRHLNYSQMNGIK